MKTEIAVVGAGPAGSVAAGILAQLGHDVVLIDKAEFPRDKNCGDAVGPMGLDIISELGLSEKLKAANPQPVRSVRIIFNQQLAVSLVSNSDDRVIVLPRTKFDAVLYDYAMSVGARPYKALVRKPLIENDRIIGVEVIRGGATESIFARVVLIADGANSSSARILNQAVPVLKGFAFRTYIENLETEPHRLDFYLEGGSFGYGWIFPVDGTTANVGFGLLNSRGSDEKTIKRLYDDFIRFCVAKSPNPASVVIHPTGGSQLNLGYQKKFKRVFDGALILGDAARLINPASGAGITNAMNSGKLAAEIVDKELKRNDVSANALREYENRLSKQLYWEQRFAKFVIDLNHLPAPVRKYIIQSSSIVKFLALVSRRLYANIPEINIDKELGKDGRAEIRISA